MSLRYETLAPMPRRLLAASTLLALALLVGLPAAWLVSGLVSGAAGLGERQARVERQVAQLATRRDAVLARRDALGRNADLVGLAIDSGAAEAAFAASVETLATRLTDAGASLDAEAVVLTDDRGEGRELRATLSGLADLESFLVALAAPELAELRIDRFDIVALAGTEPVRVRFAVQTTRLLPAREGVDD